MNEFKPVRTATGIALEPGSWPEGFVEDSYILVEGKWKNIRRGGWARPRTFVHDAPEIGSFDQAEAALKRLHETAWRHAAKQPPAWQPITGSTMAAAIARATGEVRAAAVGHANEPAIRAMLAAGDYVPADQLLDGPWNEPRELLMTLTRLGTLAQIAPRAFAARAIAAAMDDRETA